MYEYNDNTISYNLSCYTETISWFILRDFTLAHTLGYITTWPMLAVVVGSLFWMFSNVGLIVIFFRVYSTAVVKKY